MPCSRVVLQPELTMSRIQEKQLLMSLKQAAGKPGPQLGLRAGVTPAVCLRPVATRREVQSESDVRCLTEWRNKFVTSFLTEFKATESRTSDWLANTVGPDDSRILFMVDDSEGLTIGYMGIAFIDWKTGYGEVDAVVRGRTAAKGVMTAAMGGLLMWGRGQLGLDTIGVRVRSDNPALAFYRKAGFVERKRVPLSCRSDSNGLVWYEDHDNVSATISLVYHTIDGERHAHRSE
jgi:RimJ/RimL family protein N-acetyltransferase